MRLGAQLFSVRNLTQKPEDFKSTLAKIREIGYENVQLSGAGPIDVAFIAEVSKEFDLPIVCTHVPFNRIVEDTDALIAEHKVLSCPVIGLGAMPKEYRQTREALNSFLAIIAEPVKKIKAAGLNFAYHNHAFEFDAFTDCEGANAYDIMLEECEWQFIMDTYWVEYAGKSAVDYIEKIGGARLTNIHFKDMAKDEKRSICACGDGQLDFKKIFNTCEKIGVLNVLVEQDNAPDFPDAIEQMAKSFKYLRPIIK